MMKTHLGSWKCRTMTSSRCTKNRREENAILPAEQHYSDLSIFSHTDCDHAHFVKPIMARIEMLTSWTLLIDWCNVIVPQIDVYVIRLFFPRIIYIYFEEQWVRHLLLSWDYKHYIYCSDYLFILLCKLCECCHSVLALQ